MDAQAQSDRQSGESVQSLSQDGLSVRSSRSPRRKAWVPGGRATRTFQETLACGGDKHQGRRGVCSFHGCESWVPSPQLQRGLNTVCSVAGPPRSSASAECDKENCSNSNSSLPFNGAKSLDPAAAHSADHSSTTWPLQLPSSAGAAASQMTSGGATGLSVGKTLAV